jgi:hypothetical protein
MPRGPKGEKRPADAIGNAVMIGRIATGEIEDLTTDDGKNAAAVALGRMGGKARAAGMKEIREPLPRAGAVFRVLQFLPRPQDAWRYPGNGRWPCGSGFENDGRGCPDRCTGSACGSRDLQEKDC